ncbi:hypothetical protein BJV77DRAFT_963697 [Russula vinacea]|nr:hypothetical protein BJV77DRAFT_963697 [Russula vinacea]
MHRGLRGTYRPQYNSKSKFVVIACWSPAGSELSRRDRERERAGEEEGQSQILPPPIASWRGATPGGALHSKEEWSRLLKLRDGGEGGKTVPALRGSISQAVRTGEGGKRKKRKKKLGGASRRKLVPQDPKGGKGIWDGRDPRPPGHEAQRRQTGLAKFG